MVKHKLELADSEKYPSAVSRTYKTTVVRASYAYRPPGSSDSSESDVLF
jgi:hypothetical protein